MSKLTDISMKHDLHVHTTLSKCCNDPEQTVKNILHKAEKLGMTTIGFANHMWENPVHEPSEWYQSQNLDHILSMRSEIDAVETSVRALLGCEAEYCGDGKIGISKEAAEQLDYVIIPHTHIHMRDFVKQPAEETPEAISELMITTFKELALTGIPTGIAHPFIPTDRFEMTTESLKLISDREFNECFTIAAEKEVAIEIHPSQFTEYFGKQGPAGIDDQYQRMQLLAKSAGVKFFLGSDAHELELIGKTLQYRNRLEEMGFVDDDFITISHTA